MTYEIVVGDAGYWAVSNPITSREEAVSRAPQFAAWVLAGDAVKGADDPEAFKAEGASWEVYELTEDGAHASDNPVAAGSIDGSDVDGGDCFSLLRNSGPNG